MKKRILFSHLASHSIAVSLLLLCSGIRAQGNLQFNQVLQPSITTSNLAGSGVVSQTITVPTGKIWKIENASYARYANGNTNSPFYIWGGTSNVTVYLDEYLISDFLSSGGTFREAKFPIWLTAGDYTLRIVNHSTSAQTSLTHKATLSVIEFNIVP